MSKQFKLTIVIATYNAEKYLNTCLEYILKIKTKEVELVIIDGASNDSTIEIINRYRDSIDYYISEPDKGIYDAWNKAISVANGDWIAFIGSDDIIIPDSIFHILNNLHTIQKDIEFIFSKAEIISSKHEILGYRGKEYRFDEFNNGMSISHVFALHKRSVFQKYGLFDINYKICADYEFLMRFNNNLKSIFIPIITVKMLIGGMSFSLKAIIESYKIRRMYKYNPIILDILYTITAILGFLKYKSKLVILDEK